VLASLGGGWTLFKLSILIGILGLLWLFSQTAVGQRLSNPPLPSPSFEAGATPTARPFSPPTKTLFFSGTDDDDRVIELRRGSTWAVYDDYASRYPYYSGPRVFIQIVELDPPEQICPLVAHSGAVLCKVPIRVVPSNKKWTSGSEQRTFVREGSYKLRVRTCIPRGGSDSCPPSNQAWSIELTQEVLEQTPGS